MAPCRPRRAAPGPATPSAPASSRPTCGRRCPTGDSPRPSCGRCCGPCWPSTAWPVPRSGATRPASSGTAPPTGRSGTPPSPCFGTATTGRGWTPTCCRCCTTWCPPAPGGTSWTRWRATSSGTCWPVTGRPSRPSSALGPTRRTACGSAGPRCSPSSGTAGTPTPGCSPRCWTPTSRTRRTARTSSSARRSAGPCDEHSRTDAAWVRAYVTARAERLAPLSRREALRLLDQTGTSSTAPTA